MPEADLDLLIAAARDAGEVAMGYFRNDPKAWDKGDGAGPVTEADLAVNRLLEDRLRGARPAYGWISEESPPEETGDDAVFIVDPIDGTRAFIDGTTTFSHALAIVRDGVPVAAVVYLPAQDKLYSAVAGQGARRNGEPIRSSAASSVLLATRKTMSPDLWPGGVPGTKLSFRPSLAYRMCLVAEGRADAMVTFRPAWEWDIAAGTLIAEEAGARVTDAAGRRMRFASVGRRQDGCIVAHPPVHRDLSLRAGIA